MAGESGSGRDVTLKYKFAPDYNPVAATGVYGGVNPDGHIVAHFFLERHGLPHSHTIRVTPDGSPAEIVATDPEDLDQSMVRYVSTGVVMSCETAKAIVQWLQDKVDLAERARQGREELGQG